MPLAWPICGALITATLAFPLTRARDILRGIARGLAATMALAGLLAAMDMPLSGLARLTSAPLRPPEALLLFGFGISWLICDLPLPELRAASRLIWLGAGLGSLFVLPPF